MSYVTDKFINGEGKSIEITFIKHASLVIDYDGVKIYVDPTSLFADYSTFAKADYILVTHGGGSHCDHFDLEAFNQLKQEGLTVACNSDVAALLDDAGVDSSMIVEMENGDSLVDDDNDITITAFPAHNHEERSMFHPEDRDNGYLVNLGGFKIYIAGDTEDIDELYDLKTEEIDVCFLPVNQPYTMTEKQACNAVRMISPKIFYPYHFGQTEHQTNLELLSELVERVGVEIRLREME